MDKQTEQINATMLRSGTDFQALQVRLDTDTLIERAKEYLSGFKMVYYNDENGKTIGEKLELGYPKANALGVQSILNILSNVINPQTVQGNFYVDGQGISLKYEDFLYWFRVDLIEELVKNAPDWSIGDTDIDGIYVVLCNLVELFLSRLLNNEERKSYGETMKSSETNVLQGKGGIPLLNS